MKLFNNRKYRYFLLLPLLILILNALYFKYTAQEIQNTLLRDKYTQINDAVEMLAAAVEANPDRIWVDHESNICRSVEYLDNLYQVYAGAFKPVGGELVLITERIVHSVPFDPFAYDEFKTAISEQESGRIDVWYGQGTQYSQELQLYFRWMPLYSSSDERYLVVAGVSHYSVTNAVPMWVSAGQWASMTITFLLNAALITLIIHLSNIYKCCDGDKYNNRKDGD